jgi:hypothetical protein
MSGGLNAGYNHSLPNGEGITLCTLWLVVYFQQSGIVKIAGFLTVSKPFLTVARVNYQLQGMNEKMSIF